MIILKNMIEKEKIRNDRMIREYEKQLTQLPKGTIIKKEISSNAYYYLTYRLQGKVVSQYIGRDLDKIEALKELIKRRKQIETFLKKLSEEKATIKKMEELL